MAENGQAQDKLKLAVAAAQRGDKVAARRLLQQVLTDDRDNELAWIWMASVVDSIEERRDCLERVLKINPNNARAREALRRLGFEAPSAPNVANEAPALNVNLPSLGGTNNRTLYFAVAGALAVILLAVVLASLINANGPSDQSVLQTATAFSVVSAPTLPPTAVPPELWTATPFIGIVVTRNPESQVNLPPSFTPTSTSTGTPVPPPTATPFPPGSFRTLFTALGTDLLPGLFSINLDGTGLQPVAPNFGEWPVYSPDGTRVAFIRLVNDTPDVTPAEGAPPNVGFPQLFVAPANDLAAAVQWTRLTGTTMSRPAWTPDGTRIVFSNDDDGDSELYFMDAPMTDPQFLTENEFDDTDPMVLADGNTVVYASDALTPDSPELFSVTFDERVITQLTDGSGSSSAPALSPDGQRMVYVSSQRGDSDIWIADVNGQRPFLVTIDDGDAQDRSPVWTPDGRWIAFVSNRGGTQFQIYLISPDGTTLLPVTSGSENVQSLTILPILP